jgi:hypothetical protein
MGYGLDSSSSVWLALVNTVMNFRFEQSVGNLLSG